MSQILASIAKIYRNTSERKQIKKSWKKNEINNKFYGQNEQDNGE